MRFEWDEAKRKSNLKAHDLDFAAAEIVFGGLTASYEDDRFRYDEQRFVTLGLLRGVPVSIVHTESQDVIRIISFRRTVLHRPILPRRHGHRQEISPAVSRLPPRGDRE